MALPTEIRRVSWRGVTLALIVGSALAWSVGELHAQQQSAVAASPVGLPVLPLQILFFVLGAGFALGAYTGCKLLIHHIAALRNER